MSEWISVKERLPEKPGYYLTKSWKYKRYAVKIFYMNHHCYGDYFSNPRTNQYITHWMPLPEPPEKE